MKFQIVLWAAQRRSGAADGAGEPKLQTYRLGPSGEAKEASTGLR